MNEDFVDGWMEILEQAAQVTVLDILQQVADDLIELVSTPVSGRGRRAIRSAPGEPPRMETGELSKSIFVRVLTDTESGDIIGGELVVAARHARWLEEGTKYMAARPYVAVIVAKWQDVFESYLGTELIARINS